MTYELFVLQLKTGGPTPPAIPSAFNPQEIPNSNSSEALDFPLN